MRRALAIQVVAGVFLLLICAHYFRPALSYYFSQDDYPLLATSRPGWVSPGQFFLMGSPREYRPLTQHYYFYLNQLLFDLDPVGHHSMNLLVHLCSALLVGWLARRWIAPWTFLPAAFFFALHPVHFFEIFWVSGISQSGFVFFLLLTLAGLVRYLDKGAPLWYFFSLLGASAALLSKEDATALPAMVSVLLLLNPGVAGRRIRLALPFWLLLGTYLTVRIVVLGFGLPDDQIYRPQLDAGLVLQKGVWYLQWLLLRWWFALPLLVAGLMLLRPWRPSHLRHIELSRLSPLLLFAALAVISVLPSLAVASTSNYYLSFASACLAWGIVSLAHQGSRNRRLLVLPLAALFLVGSYQERRLAMSASNLALPVPIKAEWCRAWTEQLRTLHPRPDCSLLLRVNAPLAAWEKDWLFFLPWIAWDRPITDLKVQLGEDEPVVSESCLQTVTLTAPR